MAPERIVAHHVADVDARSAAAAACRRGRAAGACTVSASVISLDRLVRQHRQIARHVEERPRRHVGPDAEHALLAALDDGLLRPGDGGDDVVAGGPRAARSGCRARPCRTARSWCRRSSSSPSPGGARSRPPAVRRRPAPVPRDRDGQQHRGDGAAARHSRPQQADRIEIVRLHHELEREAHADRQHQEAEQQPQPLAAHVLSGARAELRADHAADHEDQRQHRVDQVVGGGVHHRRRRHGDQRQHHRGADHGRGRHPQEIDQHRHQQEAAADAHDGADEADDEADRPDRDGRDVDLRALEPHLQRQPVDPGVRAAAPRRRRLALLLAHDGAHALADHQAADGGEQQHVGKADGEVELAERAQHREQPDADRGAEDAAGQQHQAERQIDGAPPPIRDRRRSRTTPRCGSTTLATATAGEMPMKIRSGVIRKPPPMPNIPEMNPTASPIARTRKMLTGRSAMGR